MTRKSISPQAFRSGVSPLALITALTFPVTSSITTVVAGRPPSPPFLATETILHAIPPALATREGMNKLVMELEVNVILGGHWIEGIAVDGLANWDVSARKTLRCDSRAISGSRVERIAETSEAVRIVIAPEGVEGLVIILQNIAREITTGWHMHVCIRCCRMLNLYACHLLVLSFYCTGHVLNGITYRKK